MSDPVCLAVWGGVGSFIAELPSAVGLTVPRPSLVSCRGVLLARVRSHLVLASGRYPACAGRRATSVTDFSFIFCLVISRAQNLSGGGFLFL